MNRRRLRMTDVMDHYRRVGSLEIYGSDVSPCDICGRVVNEGHRVVRYTLDSKSIAIPPSATSVVQVCADCENRMLVSR